MSRSRREEVSSVGPPFSPVLVARSTRGPSGASSLVWTRADNVNGMRKVLTGVSRIKRPYYWLDQQWQYYCIGKQISHNMRTFGTYEYDETNPAQS